MLIHNQNEIRKLIYGGSKEMEWLHNNEVIFVACKEDEFKWKATYSDSSVQSAQCDASSVITEGEINLTNLVSVEIGDCATGFAQYAFYNCGTLKDVVIGNGIETIGAGVFYKCTSLTSVTIPNSVTSIGYVAFRECKSLESVTIPDSVTAIKADDSSYSNAFRDCSGLTSVTIGSGVTFIGNGAFYGCTSLTGVTIYATTPPSLSDVVFSKTNNCPIYVPAASVDAYKSADRWSTLADRIQPIGG